MEIITIASTRPFNYNKVLNMVIDTSRLFRNNKIILTVEHIHNSELFLTTFLETVSDRPQEERITIITKLLYYQPDQIPILRNILDHNCVDERLISNFSPYTEREDDYINIVWLP
jgi:hypothetical protein